MCPADANTPRAHAVPPITLFCAQGICLKMNHETSWVLFSPGCPPLSHLDSCPCLDAAPRKVYCRRGTAPGRWLQDGLLAAFSLTSLQLFLHPGAPSTAITPALLPASVVTMKSPLQVGAKCSCFCSLAPKGFSIHNKKVINVKLPLPAPTDSKIITL